MSLFNISSILIFFASLGFGLFVYLNNIKSKLNQSWLLFSSLIAVWGLSLYGVTSSGVLENAMLWQYVLDIVAIFIPVLYLNFISSFLELKNKTPIYASFVLGFVLAFFSSSSYFKIGLNKDFGFYWITPGQYYYLFPVFFVACVAYALFLLLKVYRKNETSAILKGQIRLQFFAGLIGFSGGITNFLPQLFNIFPFGNYFILLYIFFISYSILKYRLFNLKTVATELFSGGVALLFLFNLLTSQTISEFLIRLLLLVLVSFFSVLIVRSVVMEVEQREKIQKLAEDLEKANARLRELDQQKTEFLSFASHQLRAPLTAIKGYASMITEGSYGEVSDRVKDSINKIFVSSQHLLNLIEDFLNITRIELGKMEYKMEKVDLGVMAKDIIDALMPNAHVKKLDLSFTNDHNGPYDTSVDSEKIRQVLLNLIDNAIKYTPSGFVKVNLSKNNGKILFAVSDSGLGISQELKGRLFEKFSRGNEVSKMHVNGTGLGLFVAKEMIKAHGGDIRVESEGEGKGSTFFVEFKAI